MARARFVFSTLLVVLLAGLTAGSVAMAAENYKIDTSHSMVVFRVKHLGVSNNYGRFNDVTGTYSFDAENPGESSFDVKVKTESVDTHDAKRDQHLKSPDFFNAKQFPVIALKSKSVKKKGDNAFEVTAELSMLGKKKEIAFVLEHVGAGNDPWGTTVAASRPRSRALRRCSGAA